MSGTITFKGDPPAYLPAKVLVNPEYCGNRVFDETFRVNPQNKGLENVVVSIEGIEKGKKSNDELAILKILKCRFLPHVLAGLVGSSYEVQNLDPVPHFFRLQGNDQTILNVAMPPNGKNIKQTMSASGIFTEACTIHSFMKGAIFVAPNPYFSATDKNGNYWISDIPPGKYRVKIWHEGLTPLEKEIVIPPQKQVKMSVNLSLNKTSTTSIKNFKISFLNSSGLPLYIPSNIFNGFLLNLLAFPPKYYWLTSRIYRYIFDHRQKLLALLFD